MNGPHARSPGMGPGPATGVVEPRDPLASTPKPDGEGASDEEDRDDEAAVEADDADEDDDVPSVPEVPSPDGDDA